MTRIAVVLTLALCVPASAFADRTSCWFGRGGPDAKNGVRCKVRLEEDRPPVSVEAERERVKLEVECSNGFRLEDREAKQFDKDRDEFNVGTRRDKIALLEIFNEALTTAQPEREKRALLIISEDDRNNGRVLRLKGKCKGGDREE